ncbi:MAG: CRISPR-associated endonuclease Cas2 [Candidatus Staskawiczbacteria bacterium]|nr:CRISPR-associated endonuclease Cas2 [Candidatus Staskawiczbacteria bacterium]MBI3337465.1 CRISPR-associated endonuclease Cas2 [Candidatus Staskawiczbacteria bacterium]
MILTKKGVHKALKASFKIENASKKKKRKDGKWIMVIFDIPKKNEKKRGILRSVLQDLGYKMFQKSVWISPYDVFERTEKLLQFYSLDAFVRILLVEEIK